MKAAKKKKKGKYDTTLKLNASLDEVLEVAMSGNPPAKPKAVKK